jgi:hypothetical protein
VTPSKVPCAQRCVCCSDLMSSPSKKSLLAAALAADVPAKQAPPSGTDTPVDHLLTLAADLRERISVLQILDGSAPQWPGITACIDLLYEVAADASKGLQAAYKGAQEASNRIKCLEADLDAQRSRAEESEDALAASDAENGELTRQIEYLQAKANNLQSEVSHERADKERKVCSWSASGLKHTVAHRRVNPAHGHAWGSLRERLVAEFPWCRWMICAASTRRQRSVLRALELSVTVSKKSWSSRRRS